MSECKMTTGTDQINAAVIQIPNILKKEGWWWQVGKRENDIESEKEDLYLKKNV